MAPQIERVETFEFVNVLPDVRTSPVGPLVYAPGEESERSAYAIRIHTDAGETGEFVGGNGPAYAQIDSVADYLVGKDPLKRERHWTKLKRGLRKYDRMGIGPIDIALWDFAGKHRGAPIHELLGSYRESFPAYASTYFGTEDIEGGLDSPDAYADFAESCRHLGFPAFKIHPIDGGDVDSDVRTVRAVAERVGEEMDLMLDPVCGYETFGDALAVGEACDAHDFYWYEDPYMDAGTSQHGHRKLREALSTPLLQAEMIRGVETHTDAIDADATDFVRADPIWDGGITGAMKIVRVAEGHGLDVEFHLPGPHVRQCMAAARNANFYELGLVHPDSWAPHCELPVYDTYTDDAAEALDADGRVHVPEGPGLGVTYDWDYVESNAVTHRVYG